MKISLFVKGGEGCEGTILNITNWDRDSIRSVATVQWDSGNTNIYRLGHHGKVDIKAVQEIDGGLYYPGHLPRAGKGGCTILPRTFTYSR